MPELPEVERARRIAERALVGKRIQKVATVEDGIVYDRVAPSTFARKLSTRRVTAARRRGKYLWLELDRPPWPLFHFGMTGSFVVYRDRRDRPRFWKVELLMDDGTRLAMPNARRLGRIRLIHDPARDEPLIRLGFDPLLDMPSARRLAELIGRRRAPIKAVLLDQGTFAGVGNWIADEVLYQARIDPHRLASGLTPGEVARLRRQLLAIIKRACDVDADSDRFPRTWLFHVRWDRGRPTRRGEPVIHDRIAGRTTAWVPSRQR